MTTYTKWVCTGVCLIAAYIPLVWALGMMNRPNDRALYEGLAVVLGLLAVVPAILRSIWRRR
jgi:hypothetical protein